MKNIGYNKRKRTKFNIIKNEGNKMKKTVKILTAIMLLITITFIATTVFAQSGGYINPTELTGTQVTTEQIQNIGNTIIGIIQAVGSIIAVAVLLVIGIKYMMGSAEEKAEYKKTLLPYVVGAIILLFASNIVAAIFNLFGNA